jgi:quercetin dioxygenase-like cupin family protein
VCLVLDGELTLHSEDGESVTLGQYDSARIEPWETHSVENTGDEPAVGLDVFAPGRSFDFWTDRRDDE